MNFWFDGQTRKGAAAKEQELTLHKGVHRVSFNFQATVGGEAVYQVKRPHFVGCARVFVPH